MDQVEENSFHFSNGCWGTQANIDPTERCKLSLTHSLTLPPSLSLSSSITLSAIYTHHSEGPRLTDFRIDLGSTLTHHIHLTCIPHALCSVACMMFPTNEGPDLQPTEVYTFIWLFLWIRSKWSPPRFWSQTHRWKDSRKVVGKRISRYLKQVWTSMWVDKKSEALTRRTTGMFSSLLLQRKEKGSL